MTQKRTKATQRKSSSARKVGIEMLNHYLTDPARPSSSARKVGIEINHLIPWRLHPSSSARKVGIEISFAPEVCQL